MPTVGSKEPIHYSPAGGHPNRPVTTRNLKGLLPSGRFSGQRQGVILKTLRIQDGRPRLNLRSSYTWVMVTLACCTFGGGEARAQGLPTIHIGAGDNGPPTFGPKLPALLGVNHSPVFVSTTGTAYEVAELYKQVGIKSVRTHDDVFDPCKVYTDDTVRLNGVVVGNCTPATTAADDVLWASNSSPPSAAAYTWGAVNVALTAINKANANVYLRLGESWNGSDQVDDPSDYAGVAATLASHVAGLASIEYAEIWNEPEGRFWEEATGPTAFYDLYDELVTQATVPLSITAGGAGFTHSGIENMSTTAIVNDWPTLAHPSGNDFISGHHYGACLTGSSNEEYLVDWLDAVQAELVANQLTVPLHVTEWNLDLPSSGCTLFGQPTHASYTAASLIIMSQDEFNIQRSHFYSGIGNGVGALFHPNGTNVSANPASYGFWGYKSLASKIRVSTTQNWGTGSGTAADAARAGIQWFAQAGSNVLGTTWALVVNDQSVAMNVKVVTGWVPTSSASVQQVSGLTPVNVPAPFAGTTRTVTAADAAIPYAIPSVSRAWTIVGSTGEMVITLPAYSITLMKI